MPYKRKGSTNWQITVNGTRQSSGTTDRQRAATLEHKLNHEAWDAKRLGIKFRTWDEADLSFLERKQAIKSAHIYAQYSKFWEPHFTGKRLKGITCDLAREILKGKPEPCPSNTTANLKMAYVGKVLRHAGAPWEPQYYPEPKGREEWLTVASWKSLDMSTDLRQVATFSLSTGLREANVIGLQWEWIKGSSLRVPSQFTKTARPYGIPLNKTALGIIEERRQSGVVALGGVFTLKGRSIYTMQLLRAWRAVLEAAGVPYMPYHGLRHTYASWMMQAGVPFEVIARLGCWSAGASVAHRYMHFDVESLRPWAERFDTILAQPAQDSQQNNAVA
jgi:integrase